MHRQVKERVLGAIWRSLPDASQGSVQVGQFCVVLRVFGDPLKCQRFDGLHGLLAQAFGIDRAKEAPHIGLGRIEHGVIVPQVSRPSDDIG